VKKMEGIVFDAGPVISLSLNSLLFVVTELKKHYDGIFVITPAVKSELIDVPIKIKRFKLESLQVLKLILDGTFHMVSDPKISAMRDKLSSLANNIYSYNKNPIKILHSGELEAISAAVILKMDTLVIDERTTRVLMESPRNLRELLHKKLHKRIDVDSERLNEFLSYVKGIRIVRSAEFVAAAFRIGIIRKEVTSEGEDKIVPHLDSEILDSVLWGVKLKGCSITESEIDSLEQFLHK